MPEIPDTQASFVVEIAAQGGATLSAEYLQEGSDEPVFEVVRSQTHERSFWGRAMMEVEELSCFRKDDEFCWRVYTERRGLWRGAVLSLFADDAEAIRADGDPLWTVGTLGREHLPNPSKQTSDTRAPDLWVRLDHDGPDFRLVADQKGEFWGSVESIPAQTGHVVNRWNRKGLGVFDLERADETGAIVELDIDDGLEQLDEAFAQSAPLIAWMLGAFAT